MVEICPVATPSLSLPLGCPVALLPLPHSALSGTGLQSMTHMPAPAPSPLQPSDSSPLLFATTKSHLGLVLLG